MNKERLELLTNYIKAGVSPLLIQNIPTDFFSNSVVLNTQAEVCGHYENTQFVAPAWYQELLNKSKNNIAILLIENINEIPINEQTKFIEILKYKKVSTFMLPKNCLIVVTCTDLNTHKINEEVYSLLVHI